MRVISDAAEITACRSDRNLATVFELLVLVAGGGYLVSLAAALWANVMRKRRPLSVIRLLGGSRRVLLAFPLVQALTVATLGSLLALVLFGAGATFVNLRFGAQLGAGRPVCTLPRAISSRPSPQLWLRLSRQHCWAAGGPPRSSPMRACAMREWLLVAALLLAPRPCFAQAQTAPWPRQLYNPQPQPDDLELPLPCGGALALRPVPTPHPTSPWPTGRCAWAGPITTPATPTIYATLS